MNKEIEETNKRIEDMAKYCPYHIKGVCFVNLTHPAECDLICEMHGAFSLLDLAGYRKTKVGRWKQTEEQMGWHDVGCAECSVCGESWVLDDNLDFDLITEYWQYCPNCGAKMEGEKEDGC